MSDGIEVELATLAETVGGTLEGDASVRVRGVAGVGDAGEGDLTFVSHPRYLDQLERSRAAAVIVPDGLQPRGDMPRIRVADAYLGFLRALQLFERPRAELFPPGVHAAANVEPGAELGRGVHVGAHAYVGPRARVGDGSVVAANCVLLDDARVGRECLLYPGAVVREGCVLGDRVILHAGAVVGADGFGYAPSDGVRHKIPQVGNVVLGDDVEVGANSCIDRATTGTTRIGPGTKIDNLVQVGHNVVVGANSVMCAQVGISGSTRVGDGVVLGGQVGVAGHIEIGDGVQAAGKSGVSKDTAAGQVVAGIPARDHREWRRLVAHESRLGHYVEQIRQLEVRLARLEGSRGAEATEDA